MNIKKMKISVVGLGYVGLPLAIEFAKKYKVVGFDINKERIRELKEGKDRTKEIKLEDLKKALENGLDLSSCGQDIADANIYIVTVPTPINHKKEPDLSYLLDASKFIAQFLNKGDIVIYESTVYPGCTEEDCVPVLEKGSGLKYNKRYRKNAY